MTVSVGGEIGEVGKQNSTVEELRAYLDGYRRELDARAPGRDGHLARSASRPAPRTAASRCPDGGVAEVKLDFEVLRELGEVAREYGLAGAVQHGASTLPDELFHRFPAVETAEIHLATGFQNALYEHPAFPAALHREIEAWCFANAADERKPGQTDQQFVYTTRKKAIGPFKRQLWELETKDEILAAQRRKIALPVHRAPGQRVARRWSTGTSTRSSSTGRIPDGAQRGRRACARRLKRASSDRDVDAVLSSRAGPSAGRRAPARIVRQRPSAPRVSTPEDSSHPDGAVGGGDLVAGPVNTTAGRRSA